MSIARVSVPAPIYPYQKLYDYRIPPDLIPKIVPGSLVEVEFGRRKTWALVFEVIPSTDIALEKLKFLSELKLEHPVFEKSHLDFLKWLSEYYFYPLGEVCESAIPAAIREGTSRTLDLSKYLEGEINPGTLLKDFPQGPTLNSFQKNAIEIFDSKEDPKNILLFGVTGSGKTEVYLKMIEKTLSEGKSAMVLVPEIALTPQLTDRFSNRFPGQVAVFHSGLKKTQSRKSWMDVYTGQRHIALGARSALFAPLKNLGCVIIDEEHDSSYKQDERLKYHARESAKKLCELSGAKLVLGSATPSAESLYWVKQGVFKCVKLPKRAIESAQLPEVHIVDMKKNLAEKSFTTPPGESEGHESTDINAKIEGDFYLSPQLREKIQKVLDQKKQAILFLNRRGVAANELCRKCGYIHFCPDCDIKLTPHFKELLCHYCGFKTQSPSVCPSCNESESPFVKIGVGTESLEQAIKFHFPKSKVLRLDRDTAHDSASLFEILNEFKESKADILIGTQMVAKGHDFPQVTLVGILAADMGLGVPDFRSFEKNAQLLLQVAGRAGRADDPGEVILQTFQPEHPVFELVKNHSGLEEYENFLSEEMSKREVLNYPPVGKLVLLRFEGFDLENVKKAAQVISHGLNRAAEKSARITVLGPAPSPITKLRSRYRFQILVKSTDSEVLRKALLWILDGWETQKLEKTYNTRLIIDVDPVAMM